MKLRTASSILSITVTSLPANKAAKIDKYESDNIRIKKYRNGGKKYGELAAMELHDHDIPNVLYPDKKIFDSGMTLYMTLLSERDKYSSQLALSFDF